MKAMGASLGVSQGDDRWTTIVSSPFQVVS